jgi:hypothetical protein
MFCSPLPVRPAFSRRRAVETRERHSRHRVAPVEGAQLVAEPQAQQIGARQCAFAPKQRGGLEKAERVEKGNREIIALGQQLRP